MEVFAEAHRADLLEEAETRALLRTHRTLDEGPSARPPIRQRIRLAIVRRLTRAAAAS
jgi:hypothetical protein